MNALTVVDLFCGGGGLSEGFEQAGFEIVAGIDVWESALETYGYNHPAAETIRADARHIRSIPECDVLIGSPPCYEFSVAKQSIRRTFNLDCANVFLRFVKQVKPKYWVMENSPELGKYLLLPHQILKACGYELRQRRRRAFFGTIPADLRTPCNGHRHIPAVCATEWKGCSSMKNMHKLNRFADYLERKATIDECMKEMGFPDNYFFFGTTKEQYIQIGNAVCPPVSRAIAEAIKNDFARVGRC